VKKTATRARSDGRGATLIEPDTGMLFVSHATRDKELANSLVNLIRLGTNLTSNRIRCTALEGMGVPTGDRNYSARLRANLAGAALVLPLLTPAFFDSEMCLVELGALWVLEESATFPIVVPPIDFERVERLLGKWQGARIDSTPNLHELRDKIHSTFELPAPNTALWDDHREDFTETLPVILERLAKPSKVSAAQYEKLEQRSTDLKQNVIQLQRQLEAQEKQLEAVAKLKDASEVAPLLVPETEVAHFEQVRGAAADAVSQLPREVGYALYEKIAQNALYYPDQYDIDACENAVRAGYLYFDEDEQGFQVDVNNDEVDDAQDKISALFETRWSAELAGEIKSVSGVRFDKRLMPAWEHLKLL